MSNQTIEFKAVAAEKYISVQVDASAVLKSWKASLFSFEWLDANGGIRTPDDMPIREREKRLDVEQDLKDGHALDKPILGIGLMDNIEIGAGKAVFLTLAAMGHKTIPVAIPKSCEKDFKSFIVR
jgi:hypothetical protein